MCERCASAPAREFHHRTYERQGHEKPDDIEHLCSECHRSIHFDAIGNFWLDESEKLDYWSAYEKEMEKG